MTVDGTTSAAVSVPATATFASDDRPRLIGFVSSGMAVPSSSSEPRADVPKTRAMSGRTTRFDESVDRRAEGLRAQRFIVDHDEQPEQDGRGRKQEHQERPSPAEQCPQRYAGDRREDRHRRATR